MAGFALVFTVLKIAPPPFCQKTFTESVSAGHMNAVHKPHQAFHYVPRSVILRCIICTKAPLAAPRDKTDTRQYWNGMKNITFWWRLWKEDLVVIKIQRFYSLGRMDWPTICLLNFEKPWSRTLTCRKINTINSDWARCSSIKVNTKHKKMFFFPHRLECLSPAVHSVLPLFAESYHFIILISRIAAI